MTQALFRNEVLEEQRQNVHGQISLAQPVSIWVLTSISGSIALAIILMATLASYSRRHQVSGHVVPVSGLSTVMAPTSGMLEKLAVTEGQHVQAGQLLGVIQVPRATVQAGDVGAALEQQLGIRNESMQAAGQARLREIESSLSGIQQQTVHITTQRHRLQREIQLRQQQVALAQETLERYESLMDDQYVSGMQVRQQRAALIEQQIALEQMHRQSGEFSRQLAELGQSRIEQLALIQRQGADNKRQLAELDQETLQTLSARSVALTAPVDGVVSGHLFKTGELVREGQPLMKIIAGSGAVEAQLLVPSRAIGTIKTGASVLIRYEAFPYQHYGRFRGTVVEIGRSALDKTLVGELTDNATDDPHYRVTVSLQSQHINVDGKAEPLRPGLLLQADIVGERRRLWQWMFDPARSLAGNLQP
mgnify:CR=1 FL=1